MTSVNYHCNGSYSPFTTATSNTLSHWLARNNEAQLFKKEIRIVTGSGYYEPGSQLENKSVQPAINTKCKHYTWCVITVGLAVLACTRSESLREIFLWGTNTLTYHGNSEIDQRHISVLGPDELTSIKIASAKWYVLAKTVSFPRKAWIPIIKSRSSKRAHWVNSLHPYILDLCGSEWSNFVSAFYKQTTYFFSDCQSAIVE